MCCEISVYLLAVQPNNLQKNVCINEAHQGVMTDRRHSLKGGDRLYKKERQTTVSDWEKATNCNLCYGSKVTAKFITIKQATKQLQNERQVTWVTPLVGLINSCIKGRFTYACGMRLSLFTAVDTYILLSLLIGWTANDNMWNMWTRLKQW